MCLAVSESTVCGVPEVFSLPGHVFICLSSELLAGILICSSDEDDQYESSV